jgi:hypothetical protein
MNCIKLCISGGRDFNDYELLKLKLNEYKKKYKDLVIITGCAQGADILAVRYARQNDLKFQTYKANWLKYSKGAGFINNQTLYNNADIIICFWDGKSHGTGHMIRICKQGKKPFEIVNYKK